MASLKDKEILVIDDAADIRKLARKILESNGAVVTESEEVKEGLELASQHRPHLILLDLNFGSEDAMSGYQFLQERLASTWKEIPTLVLSGRNDKASVTRAISLGATDYLLKPFRTTVLLQKVWKALRMASFQSYRFTEKERPQASVHIHGQVEKLSEVSLIVNTSVKMAPDQTVRLTCDELKFLEEQKAITKTSSRPSLYGSSGRYLSEILFTGVGENFSKSLRKTLKGA